MRAVTSSETFAWCAKAADFTPGKAGGFGAWVGGGEGWGKRFFFQRRNKGEDPEDPTGEKIGVFLFKHLSV